MTLETVPLVFVWETDPRRFPGHWSVVAVDEKLPILLSGVRFGDRNLLGQWLAEVQRRSVELFRDAIRNSYPLEPVA